MTCLNYVLLGKAVTGVALNTFPNVLLIFNICQYLSIISLIFGKLGLYVTENGITFFRTALVLFNRVDLTRLSTFSIWFRMMFSFYPFSTNRLIKSFECCLYSSKVIKHVTFLDEDEDVQNLHGDNFDGQLAFHKVLFANGCYGFYKVKCLKIRYSLWKI